MKSAILIFAASLLVTGCVHKLTMRAHDGERLDGRWRFAREGNGLLQVVSAEGEVLVGVLTLTPRGAFFESYQTVFGTGAIVAEQPDLSAYGHGFWLFPGTGNALVDVVHGDNHGLAITQVAGPLFYWMAHLQGDRRTFMQCFLIGSTHSTSGLGRCKGAGGKEYAVRF